MPAKGERRSGATETVEWNGSRWVPVDAAPAAPAEAPQEGALSRFLSGAMKTTPFNPMNWVRFAQDIPGSVLGTFADPMKNLLQVPGDVKATITGERGDRLSSAAQAVEHLGGSVPIIGPAGIAAGEKMGNGDIAGGAGELAGLASLALMPNAIRNTPKALTKVGGAIERGGTALTTKGLNTPMGTITPGGLGIAQAILHMNPTTAAIAAAPYALKYGGKAMRMAGEGLDSLRNPPEAPVAPEPWDPAGPSRAAKAKAAQKTAYDLDAFKQRGQPSTEPLSPEDFNGMSQTYGRSGYPGLSERAAAMGDSTIDTLRRGGYDVPEGGFRSSADIDAVANGPRITNPAFLKFALDESAPAAAPEAAAALKALKAGQYEAGPSPLDVTPKRLGPSPVRGELPPARYIEGQPSSVLEGQKALPPADYGVLDPDMPADFEFEAGDPDIPGLTVDANPSGILKSRQTAALSALMDSPSFRGLRR